MPKAARIGVLVNPTNVEITERTVKDVNAAADALGLQIQVLNASNGNEIDAAFTTLVSGRADGLLVGPDAFFVSRRVQIAILAARHMIPGTYRYLTMPRLVASSVMELMLLICFASKVSTLGDSQGNQAGGPASGTSDEI